MGVYVGIYVEGTVGVGAGGTGTAIGEGGGGMEPVEVDIVAMG